MSKHNKGYDYSPETVAEKRKFPVLATVGLCICIAVQAVCALVIALYDPQPQDVIEEYTIYITPREDGSLDIKYSFIWTPLDDSDDLTWVEIGMANEDFTLLDSRSDNIDRIVSYVDDGYCSAQVYFDRAYGSHETMEFYFTVNQKRVLLTDGVNVFFGFVPGWFNYTPVEHYAFYFEIYGDIESYNGDSQNLKWLVWEGSLECGGYVPMQVNYNSFDAPAVYYEYFDDSGCYDGLSEDKTGMTVFMIMLIIFGVIIEVGVIDTYVSYNRGRGFLRGYGYPVHVYGRVNPRYNSAANARRGGGGGGRGCACACACACAGGGRAGCSQKDTYYSEKDIFKTE